MKAVDKVYEQLLIMSHDYGYVNGVTATELESVLNIKRSVISHYLNLLYSEGRVLKTSTRPVRYYTKIDKFSAKLIKEDDRVFDSFIGAEGSLKEQVEQCKSAVLYPPDGLPVIISGSSGVGKSFLASLIYKYAVSKNKINRDAPFVELNCADYANNPELLSSVLFGYVKGAFTGADKEKSGLMDEADGGYLFLDEVHRLSYENQEKLFMYFDNGKFRRLGENETWHNVKVRFIFATTEDVQATLLETFYRRIPVRIVIPDFQERPTIEKIAIINSFFRDEAVKLNKDISLEPEVINILASSASKGNIGTLKNYIKLSCADAYKNQPNDENLFVTLSNLPKNIIGDKSKTIKIKSETSTYIIKKDSKIEMEPKAFMQFSLADDVSKLIYLLNTRQIDKFKETAGLIIIRIKNMMLNIYGLDISSIENAVYENQFIKFLYIKLNDKLSKITKKYGFKISNDSRNDLFYTLIYAVNKIDSDVWQNNIRDEAVIIKKDNPKAFILAKDLITDFEDYCNDEYNILYLLFPVIFAKNLPQNIKIQAIIAAHGDSTASSIASVANTLCGSYIYEAFDMSMTENSEAIISRVIQYIDNVDTRYGLILLVDMGSLQDLYQPIKDHLQGELLILNNVSTYIALDIGLKIFNGYTIQGIIDEVKDGIKTEVRYYEGIAKGDNIIISCISGIGIAQKLKEVFDKYLSGKMEILTVEYNRLKHLIQPNNITQIKNTKLIVTTNDLGELSIPCLNIEKIITNEGHSVLMNILGTMISNEEFNKMADDLVRFFSIEGIANQLSFLNPSIVVNEVDAVIIQYETYYNINLKNHIKLNLYMHIAIMIERLMTDNAVDLQDRMIITNKQKEFVMVSNDAFSNIIEKYHIEIPITEILMIYEIIESEIN